MINNQNVPKLRFPEFSGEWEEKKFGEVFSFRTTNSFSRDNLNYEDGKIKNIHYGDIHTKFATLFDVTKELVPFINLDINLQRIAEDNYSKEGDLIIADASEDYEDVGKCIEVVNLNGEKVLAGLHTILARPDLHNMSIGFNGYLMKSEKIRLQIKTIAQGSKVLSISSKRLAELNIVIPKIPEQQKIANFLTAIDTKIDQLTKKQTLLKQYKKGVMQKLFSQELRFKADDGSEFSDWEEKDGGKLFESISNKKHNSDLPILAISQEHGAIPRELINYQISVTDKSVDSYKIVDVGDFIISLRSFQGGTEYSNYKGICSPAYIILRSKVKIDNTFYKYY
jgi:type I restriction enzyme S subunit